MPKKSPDRVQLSAKALRDIRQSLLKWYRAGARQLPWREPPMKTKAGRWMQTLADPYRVLVSEVMLQQTQVDTVIDYFNRFMQRFPDVQALAEANEQEVLHAWQGLGYYRRARHLHAAARAIIEEHDARFPETVEALLKLPGIGDYSAGAIASIAFGKCAAILDGNVARVLARLFAIQESIDQTTTRKQLWELARQLVPANNPGDFNQGLMELGAVVCIPRQPRCVTCPLQQCCQAYQKGLTEPLPVRTGKAKQKPVTHDVMVIHKNGHWLIEQRPDQGLWSGMWQAPTLEQRPDSDTTSPTTAERQLKDWLKQRTGLRVSMKKVTQFTHLTTHLRITYRVWQAKQITGRLKPGVGQWVSKKQLASFAMSNPARRAIEIVNEES